VGSVYWGKELSTAVTALKCLISPFDVESFTCQVNVALIQKEDVIFHSFCVVKKKIIARNQLLQ